MKATAFLTACALMIMATGEAAKAEVLQINTEAQGDVDSPSIFSATGGETFNEEQPGNYQSIAVGGVARTGGATAGVYSPVAVSSLPP